MFFPVWILAVSIIPAPRSLTPGNGWLAAPSAAARKNVLGSECCLWTEMIWNEFDLAWKAWPRACAFAEALWSAPGARDFDEFVRRMAVHRVRLLRRHVNCAPIGQHIQ